MREEYRVVQAAPFPGSSFCVQARAMKGCTDLDGSFCLPKPGTHASKWPSKRSCSSYRSAPHGRTFLMSTLIPQKGDAVQACSQHASQRPGISQDEAEVSSNGVSGRCLHQEGFPPSGRFCHRGNGRHTP